MALFLVRRNVKGLEQSDVDAAAYRAIMCAFEYEGLSWRRSFWDRQAGVIECVYEAQDAEQLRNHSMRSRIPCDEVREVTEIDPHQYTAPVPALTP